MCTRGNMRVCTRHMLPRVATCAHVSYCCMPVDGASDTVAIRHTGIRNMSVTIPSSASAALVPHPSLLLAPSFAPPLEILIFYVSLASARTDTHRRREGGIERRERGMLQTQQDGQRRALESLLDQSH